LIQLNKTEFKTFIALDGLYRRLKVLIKYLNSLLTYAFKYNTMYISR